MPGPGRLLDAEPKTSWGEASNESNKKDEFQH